MIVEFTGPSGSGKTFLRERVAQELESRGQSTGFPLTSLWGSQSARWQNSPRITNMLLDTVLPPYLLAKFRGNLPTDHAQLSAYCQQLIALHARNLSDRLRLIRSMLRKLALDRYFRQQRFQQHCVLVDEGLIHLAPMIMGRGQGTDFNDQCRRYAELTPKPHLLVWVSAPVEVLEQRIAQRSSHQPLPGATQSARRDYLSRSEEMLAAVIGNQTESSGILKIHNEDQFPQTVQSHVLRIADTIAALERAA